MCAYRGIRHNACRDVHDFPLPVSGLVLRVLPMYAMSDLTGLRQRGGSHGCDAVVMVGDI